MPSSYAEGKQTIAKWLGEIKPTRALDIGPGCGTYQHLVSGNYGVMVNERDKETGKRIWDLGADAEGDFVDYKGPPCDMVGIEAYYPYVERWRLKDRYKQIIIADVRYMDWNRIGEFDVAFCGDVLEHLTQEDAKLLFHQLTWLAKTVIISIPIVHFPQGAFEGNPFEEHVVEDWSFDKVVAYFGEPHKSFKGNHIGVFWYNAVT